MKKVYILHSGTSMIEDAIRNSEYYKSIVSINPTIKSLPMRILRKLHLSINFKSHIWIDLILNKYSIDDSNDIIFIIFDAPIWIVNIHYIRKKYKNIKIVFWFWNIVKKNYIKKLDFIKKNTDSICTFDKNDAQNFNLLHHNQFFWLKSIPEENILYDVIFIGKNKNRLEFLEEVYLKLKEMGVKTFFYVVKDSKNDRSNFINLKDDPLPYVDILKLISKSKAILDINHSNQTGFTLRVLEALFFNKKLITNNFDIVNYDFFNKNNIHVIRKDTKLNNNFFKSNYQKIDNIILEKYTFDYWLKKLVNDVNKV